MVNHVKKQQKKPLKNQKTNSNFLMLVRSSQTGDVKKEQEEEEGHLCPLQIFFFQ